MPIIGRLSTSSIRLPIYMLAMMPQNSVGFCWIISGPGCKPWITKAPSNSAITTFGGMPSVISGIMALPMPALLAVSLATTPSTAPLPNSSGCLERFFAMM